MATKDKTHQKLYADDKPRLLAIIVMLTKRWGRQATMADAVNYLLDQEEKAKREEAK